MNVTSSLKSQISSHFSLLVVPVIITTEGRRFSPRCRNTSLTVTNTNPNSVFKVSSGSDLSNLELRTENIPFQMHLSLVSFAGLDYYGIDCLLLFESVCRLLVLFTVLFFLLSSH